MINSRQRRKLEAEKHNAEYVKPKQPRSKRRGSRDHRLKMATIAGVAAYGMTFNHLD